VGGIWDYMITGSATLGAVQPIGANEGIDEDDIAGSGEVGYLDSQRSFSRTGAHKPTFKNSCSQAYCPIMVCDIMYRE